MEAAVEVLIAGMSEEDKATLRSMAEGDLIKLHHGWGTYVRNSLGLWRGNSDLLESCAEIGGCGRDPDAASAVVTKAAWNRLNNWPVARHQRSVEDLWPCESCGGLTRVARWEEAERARPEHLVCAGCLRRQSPDYLAEQQRHEREQEAARESFRKARALGELVNARFRDVKANSSWLVRVFLPTDNLLLLFLALHEHKTNPEFRALWTAVRGGRPGVADLRWLRLWKKL